MHLYLSLSSCRGEDWDQWHTCNRFSDRNSESSSSSNSSGTGRQGVAGTRQE